MRLCFEGHNEVYAVEQTLMALLPEERPVYGGDDPNWAGVSLTQEGDRAAAVTAMHYRGETGRGECARVLSGTEYEREGQRRHGVGRCFYLAARQVLPADPPWGMLAGVRPVKLPTAFLREGDSPEQVLDALTRDYYISPRRAQLALDCAQASLAVSRGLRDDQVSLYVGIPFCPTRCAYCSFVSADVHKALKLVPAYVEALLRELDATGETLARTGLTVHSLYMGGGTPTTLSP